MNQFGLGLIINAVDNASSIFDNITGSYNNMLGTFDSAATSAVGESMSALGDQLTGIGSKFTSFFSNIITNVRSVGSEFEGFKLTLQSLYGETADNNAKTQKAIKDLFDFSIVSPFEVSDTKDLLVTLKSQGIDAFEELADASGDTQKAMMWITDLMAFKPDVPVERWKLALTNFLGSGQGKVLENILDAGKITQIIGHDIGDTAEERMKDLLEVIDKLGVKGLAESMSGTLETKLSNIQDFMTKFFYEVAKSGAFDQIKRLVDNLTHAIIDDSVMAQENIESLAGAISQSLHVFLDPLEKATEVFKEYSTQLVQFLVQNPKILSMAFTITTLTGVLLIALGVIIKFGGVLTSFLASVKYLSGAKTMTVLFTQSLWGIVRVFGPLVAGGYLLYKVWTMNIDGIQEKVKNLWDIVKNFVVILADALPDNILSKEHYDLAKQMGLLPVIETILNLKYYFGKFWEGFKKGFEEFINSMIVTFYKIMGFARDLQPVFDVIKSFFEKITGEGLEQQWTNLGEIAGRIAGWIVFIIAILPKVVSIVNRIIGVVRFFIKIKTWAITAFSWLQSVAYPWIMTQLIRIYIWGHGVYRDIIRLYTWIVGTALPTVWGWITTAYTWLVGTAFPTIAGWFTSLATALGVSTGVLLGIIAVVIAIIAVVYVFRDEIAAFLVEAWWKVKDFFVNLWTKVTTFFSDTGNKIATFFSETKNKISKFFTEFGESVDETVEKGLNSIGGFFSGLWEEIKQNPVAQLLWSIVYAVGGILYAIFWSLVAAIGGFIQWIVQGVQDIITWVSDLWNSFAEMCKGVWEEMQNNLIEFWGIVDQFFTNIGEWITNAINWIGGFFQYLWDGIENFFTRVGEWLSNVIDWVCGFFQYMWEDVILEFIDNIKVGWGEILDWCSELLEGLLSPFEWLFDGIAKLAQWLKDEIFAPIWDAITWIINDAIQNVWNFVSPIFQDIADFIQSIKDGLSDIVGGITDFFTGIGDFFFGVGNYAREAVGLSTGGYVKTEGIAVLHPNEVVVNDELTKGLSSFLTDYDKAKFTSSPLIQQDVVAVDDNYKEVNDDNPLLPQPEPEKPKKDPKPTPMQAITNNYSTSSSDSSYHKSVVNSAANNFDYSTESIITNTRNFNKAFTDVFNNSYTDTENTSNYSNSSYYDGDETNNYSDTSYGDTTNYSDYNTEDNDYYDTDDSYYDGDDYDYYDDNDWTDNSVTSNNETHQDNSIKFEAGSIVLNINGSDLDLNNLSESQLKAIADKLMTIIARRMQLRNMQTRK